MSKYLVLIYESEDAREQDPGRNAEYDKHWTFIDDHSDAIIAGHALRSTGTATSLRKDADGTFAVTDGPWAETKEALGGFYLLEAPDLDAALELAKLVPAPYGGLEVRPIASVVREDGRQLS